MAWMYVFVHQVSEGRTFHDDTAMYGVLQGRANKTRVRCSRSTAVVLLHAASGEGCRFTCFLGAEEFDGR